MTKMTVTRALAELKRLDDRIQRGVTGTFIGVQVGTESQAKVMNGNGTSVEAYTANLQSNYDSLQSLFAQRDAIKAAVVKSNANTTVTLGARTLTVAEAIELKKSIANKQTLLTVLQRQLATTRATVDQVNAQVDAAIEANLKIVYGAEKTGKIDKDAYDLVAKPQKAAKEATLLDPLKLADKILALQEEVSLVATELDFTLSEVNAKTDLTLDF